MVFIQQISKSRLEILYRLVSATYDGSCVSTRPIIRIAVTIDCNAILKINSPVITSMNHAVWSRLSSFTRSYLTTTMNFRKFNLVSAVVVWFTPTKWNQLWYQWMNDFPIVNIFESSFNFLVGYAKPDGGNGITYLWNLCQDFGHSP